MFFCENFLFRNVEFLDVLKEIFEAWFETFGSFEPFEVECQNVTENIGGHFSFVCFELLLCMIFQIQALQYFMILRNDLYEKIFSKFTKNSASMVVVVCCAVKS